MIIICIEFELSYVVKYLGLTRYKHDAPIQIDTPNQ